MDEEDVLGGAEPAAFAEFADHAVGGLAGVDRVEDRGFEPGQPLDVLQLFGPAQGVADADYSSKSSKSVGLSEAFQSAAWAGVSSPCATRYGSASREICAAMFWK